MLLEINRFFCIRMDVDVSSKDSLLIEVSVMLFGWRIYYALVKYSRGFMEKVG